ncbi:cysteine hydrolase [Formosimonas limnophila]|uniref:Cysteine hydrolase n=1 Tax=Formosimonas limnophila TaxID=1384487 RepID=A0A8J3G0C0_9BURK|nr:cysteine hydrolase family protein [Formosimonas limnophila]GHA71955.1 cysteine hydrolase [Formosimonas limnophila]
MQAKLALIIIDMQKGMQSPVLDLVQWSRAQSFPIVHVRHISRTVGSSFWPGQAGAEFQEALSPLPHEHVVEKNVPDVFIRSGLERWLHVRGINQLIIAGVSTENSVEASVRTAGNLGFNVYVAADACFTFAKSDCSGRQRTAQEVHDIALANLQGEYATVMSALDIKQQLSN